MSKQSKRIALLLDGDYLLFSAMSASENEVDWGDDIWTLECDHNKARANLRSTIRGIRERLKEFNNAELVMVFSTANGDDNWRKQVLTSYKANRKGKRKPVGYPELLKELLNNEGDWGFYRTFQWDGLEGDDVLGILATNPGYLDVDEAIPVSCDKDFNTLPGRFYWLTNNKVVTNTLAEANRWHMYQAIKGDTTDGYGGIPGVGEQVDGVPLLEWLDNPTYFYQTTKTLKSGPRKGQEVTQWVSKPLNPDDGLSKWDCVVSLARRQGMTEEDLIVQAQVARILRTDDFCWETKRPIPWLPKGRPRAVLPA
ncbi:hypothetical protein [Metapseudomonas otitidis]|uniref:hypothetical protein n=1 Tax=Metapseudomonas otitidis TaxID=319939 RepID=UPI0013F631C7|nr:hypothetical protein [Pseudomonas otitidis]